MDFLCNTAFSQLCNVFTKRIQILILGENENMKNKVFFFLMLPVSILLFLLRMTGMTAHIALSVVGIVALVAFAILNKKEWNKPVFEILLRVLFAVAVITGIVILKMAAAPVVAIVHKAAAAAFVAMLLILYLPKLCKKA